MNGGDDGTRTRGLCRDRAPIATFGALGNLRELLLHPNCTQIAQVGFCNFPFAATSRA